MMQIISVPQTPSRRISDTLNGMNSSLTLLSSPKKMLQLRYFFCRGFNNSMSQQCFFYDLKTDLSVSHSCEVYMAPLRLGGALIILLPTDMEYIWAAPQNVGGKKKWLQVSVTRPSNYIPCWFFIPLWARSSSSCMERTIFLFFFYWHILVNDTQKLINILRPHVIEIMWGDQTLQNLQSVSRLRFRKKSGLPFGFILWEDINNFEL